MEKATVNMRNWQLYVYDERYNLSGTADCHPKLGRNVNISHTTSLVNYAMADEILTYETRNTIYICPLKFMTPHPYDNVVPEYLEKLTHRADASDSSLDRIIAASAKMVLGFDLDDEFACQLIKLQEIGQQELAMKEEQVRKRLIDIAKQYEDCVYIEVTNVETGDKLAYHLGDCTGTVEPNVHVGMFQDSVLYMKYAHMETTEKGDCALDFRYFPDPFGIGMRTYSWSDNIKLAVIKNDSNHEIIFNGISVKMGETKEFTPEGHIQGLLSPDCYNGKSMFSLHEGDS